MNNRLRTTLYAIAIYLLILGILFLFLPRSAESVFGISLPDANLTMLYGQVILTLAFIAFSIARDSSLHKLYTGFVALFGGHILIFLYQIFTGTATFAQNGPPLVISIIFSILLFFFGRK